MALFKFKWISILTLILLSASCGSPEPGSGDSAATGGYQAYLVFPEDASRLGRTTQALSGIDCDERGITAIQFNFILNGKQYGPHAFDCKNHHATISGVPAGKGVEVEVFADDANGEAMYEGSEVVDIVRDQVTPGGTVQMEYATFTNDFGMEFVRIPAANRPFTMGSPTDELGRDDVDETEHTVTLSEDYYMQVTEVTHAQWRAVWDAADAAGITIEADRDPSRFSACGDECPVESVSWEDADQFIDALNQLDPERDYALPKEAWWEYAARGGTTGALPTGNLTVEDCSLDNNLNRIGWYCGNSDADYSGCYERSSDGRCIGPQPARGKEPNAYGLYDMHGNVWEWCEDYYAADYYEVSPASDPPGPASGDPRVLRGGSWDYFAAYCRSANRSYNSPGNRFNYGGFRIASPLVSR